MERWHTRGSSLSFWCDVLCIVFHSFLISLSFLPLFPPDTLSLLTSEEMLSMEGALSLTALQNCSICFSLSTSDECVTASVCISDEDIRWTEDGCKRDNDYYECRCPIGGGDNQEGCSGKMGGIIEFNERFLLPWMRDWTVLQTDNRKISPWKKKRNKWSWTRWVTRSSSRKSNMFVYILESVWFIREIRLGICGESQRDYGVCDRMNLTSLPMSGISVVCSWRVEGN